MISVHFQGKPFNITVIQVYALTNNTEEAEVEHFYEDVQDLLQTFSRPFTGPFTDLLQTKHPPKIFFSL